MRFVQSRRTAVRRLFLFDQPQFHPPIGQSQAEACDVRVPSQQFRFDSCYLAQTAFHSPLLRTLYTNDPTAIVAIYYSNGGYIWDEVVYQKGMSNKQIADLFQNLPKALIVADSAEPKSIDEIRSYGLSVLPANKGPGSVNQGIQNVQQQKVSLTKRSVNTIKEYRNYVWITDKDGRIINDRYPCHGPEA